MDEVEKLIKALGDQDDAVRVNVVEALVKIGELGSIGLFRPCAEPWSAFAASTPRGTL